MTNVTDRSLLVKRSDINYNNGCSMVYSQFFSSFRNWEEWVWNGLKMENDTKRVIMASMMRSLLIKESKQLQSSFLHLNPLNSPAVPSFNYLKSLSDTILVHLRLLSSIMLLWISAAMLVSDF